MKMSRSGLLLCVVALIGFAGCSDDDPLTPPEVPTAAAAEAAIDSVLVEIVDPLFTVIEFFQNAATLAPATRVPCPTLGPVCSTGTLSCLDVGTQGVQFTTSGCTTTYNGETVTMDGQVTVLPMQSAVSITFSSFSVNGSTALSGAVMVDSNACSTTVNIVAADGTTLDGFIVACGNANPGSTSSMLIVVDSPGLGVFNIVFTFDGTGIAVAAVALNGVPVASCTVDLNALDASCVNL